MSKGERPPITLCMITYNEEDRLPASLGAVRDHVDRMVIVDAESEDRTVEVARELGAEVEVRPWEGFAAARRHALSLAETDWVLMIDADEVLDPALFAEIERRGMPEEGVLGYQVRRRMVYLGKVLRRAFQPDWQTVLFRRDAVRVPDVSVHEAIIVEGGVVRLQAEIRHHSYRSREDHYERIRRYARLAARDLHAAGRRATALDLWGRPAWRWFVEVFVRGAFLDGRRGILAANAAAWSVHLRYALLRRMGQEEPREEA